MNIFVPVDVGVDVCTLWCGFLSQHIDGPVNRVGCTLEMALSCSIRGDLNTFLEHMDKLDDVIDYFELNSHFRSSPRVLEALVCVPCLCMTPRDGATVECDHQRHSLLWVSQFVLKQQALRTLSAEFKRVLDKSSVVLIVSRLKRYSDGGRRPPPPISFLPAVREERHYFFVVTFLPLSHMHTVFPTPAPLPRNGTEGFPHLFRVGWSFPCETQKSRTFFGVLVWLLLSAESWLPEDKMEVLRGIADRLDTANFSEHLKSYREVVLLG